MVVDYFKENWSFIGKARLKCNKLVKHTSLSMKCRAHINKNGSLDLLRNRQFKKIIAFS